MRSNLVPQKTYRVEETAANKYVTVPKAPRWCCEEWYWARTHDMPTMIRYLDHWAIAAPKGILSDVAQRKLLKEIKINPKVRALKQVAETSEILRRSVNVETKVIFSGESKFNIFGSDGRCTVWRKPNTALDPKKLRPTVKDGGGSVMVWGGMASNGVGNLVFIDGIMDHKLYIDIHNNNLKESAKKLGLDGNFIFQQDNDSKHTARNVKMWCFFIVNSNCTAPTVP
ncbi:transposable element Tc1 transposase [Trichonephila clavipes]|nr:transposable element Tc1 transposase [Trichonephila clavipes]